MEATPNTALAQDLQAGQALTIRRKFTSPGVHPFDTVEWELRDAKIGHGGKVVGGRGAHRRRHGELRARRGRG